MAPMPAALRCSKSSNRYLSSYLAAGALCCMQVCVPVPLLLRLYLCSVILSLFLWEAGSFSGTATAVLSPWSTLCPSRQCVRLCRTCALTAARRAGCPGTILPFYLSQLIRDYSTPPNEELSRDLVAKLKPHIR